MSREAKGSRPQRPFAEMRDEGLLWLINRVVFHPRGFALAFQQEDDGTASGWSMLGMGDEVWTFDTKSDDDEFAKVEAYLAALRAGPTIEETHAPQ